MTRATNARALPWVLAACVVLGASGCRTDAERHDVGPLGYSDLTEEPPIPLARATSLVRKRVHGEWFQHAELGRIDGRAICLVVFRDADDFHLLDLDATDGTLLHEVTLEDDSEEGVQLREARERSSSAIEPATAIEIAVGTLPGSWARIVTLETYWGSLAYLVEIVSGEVVRDVLIGTADGRLLGDPSTDPNAAPAVSLTTAVRYARRLEVDAIVLEAGFEMSSSRLPRVWEILLAKSDEQLRVFLDSDSGEILRSQREVASEPARTLAATRYVPEVSRAIDAALCAVDGIAPDARAIAALLAKRENGLVYQIALAGPSSGSRIVEVSGDDYRVLSVEAVETADSMRR